MLSALMGLYIFSCVGGLAHCLGHLLHPIHVGLKVPHVEATYNMSGIAVTGALSAVHRVMIEAKGSE